MLRTDEGVILINITLQYYTVCYDDDSATYINDLLNYYRYNKLSIIYATHLIAVVSSMCFFI